MAYDVNLPFWSDHAKKRRWFGMPALDTMLGFNREGAWTTPAETLGPAEWPADAQPEAGPAG